MPASFKCQGHLFEVLAFNPGPGVYVRRANKYRYSLEKHCYDMYCTVYCFCYFNKCLTNKSGVTLTAMYMLYNKTKLKIYSNVHVPVVMTDALSFFCCSACCRKKSQGSLQRLFISCFSLVKNCAFWVEIVQ